MRVFVTGATGFLGQRVCSHLVAAGHEVIAMIRRNGVPLAGVARNVALANLGERPAADSVAATSALVAALAGCEALVHLAGRAHQGDEQTAREAFWQVNVRGTEQVVDAALRQGVSRVVFVSSAKVYGEYSPLDEAGKPTVFAARHALHPEGSYGQSKAAAEALLRASCAVAGSALSILRPPLVYGPGNKANLLSLMRAIAAGWPLPLATIRNQRSLIYVDNLAGAVGAALAVAPPDLRVYALSDVEFSTPALIAALAAGMGRRARLLPCPVFMLKLLARAGGQGAVLARLTESMVLDRSEIARELAWQPRWSVVDSMRATGDWFWRTKR